MLTIGQLADYVGVTIRTIRHYHQCGLLPEPPRDTSGYRRYGTEAVIELMRIKTLAQAGVPLARISTLLAADPEEFSQAVADIDQKLQDRIQELERNRRAMAALDGGESLILPPPVVEYLNRLRALGVSERAVRYERDGWIVMMARSRDLVTVWVKDKMALLDDPEFRRLYLAIDQAFDWDPADPGLDGLADQMIAFAAGQSHTRDGDVDATASDLLSAQFYELSPAWQRLNDLCAVKTVKLPPPRERTPPATSAATSPAPPPAAAGPSGSRRSRPGPPGRG
ncbi:MAG TPA: MerR family transcriptional regulator [Streptosporangiaceae bacterium]|jgi:DNA-binding transcriptional MerR regulator